MSKRLLLSLAVIACLLAMSPAAHAGLPHWLVRRRATVATGTKYAPEMRHYVVVDPSVASMAQPSKAGMVTRLPPEGQVLWSERVEPAPTYPWGWFGARRQVQNVGHVRFYGEARDWGTRRGD
jgi:hypothetical protein